VIDDASCRHRVDEASARQRALHRLDPDHELDAILLCSRGAPEASTEARRGGRAAFGLRDLW
jgi:hypothetical protein